MMKPMNSWREPQAKNSEGVWGGGQAYQGGGEGGIGVFKPSPSRKEPPAPYMVNFLFFGARKGA